MEKLSKESLDALWNLVSGSRRVTVVSHTHPDGDAVGSSVAMCSWLGSLGKDALMMLPTPVPSSLDFILGGQVPMIYSLSPRECAHRLMSSDLVICLDLNSLSRVEDMEQAINASPCRRVLIDHHLNPAVDQFDLCFSETEVSSACELLFGILLAMPGVEGDARRLPPLCAAALMAGMTTDTNNFANSVFPATFEMASLLLAAGVDRDAILSELYDSYRENRIRLFGEMLHDNLQITPSGVAVMYLSREIADRYDLEEGESEGLVNRPLAIGRVRLSILVKAEPDGSLRVSMRSKKGVSANQLAGEIFHGGGHEQAAGGKIIVPQDIASESEVKGYVMRMADKFMERYA